ncbi:GNAT family N-acetyltransferase [Oceanobacillus massiliensis]|uniref:GNAT family N-acetyltransferase n=1 Tax=Oceanobacillus massiliensis TaxID=1465765 RepID=UPI003015AF08
MIRLATLKDLEVIVSIAGRAVKVMNAEGSDQWDETYPVIDHFREDILHSSLFVYEEAGKIAGFITADQNFTKDYQKVEWAFPIDRCGTFHRLTVDPDQRQSNVASALITFVEEFFQKLGLSGMKIDTYSINEKAQRLFAWLGYEKAGAYYTAERDLAFFGFEKRF